MNPLAYGMEGPADLASWVFSFIFIDGKMRGLFSFLFGASTLLVIERAEAAGQSPARIHYARMLWLLVFGLIHFYFIWFGDILALYAQTGLILFLFRRLGVRALVRWGVGLVLVQSLVFAAIAAWARYLSGAARLPPDQAETWRSMQEGFVPLTGQPLTEKLALFGGPYAGLVTDPARRESGATVQQHPALPRRDARLHGARHGGAEVRLLPRRLADGALPQMGARLPWHRHSNLCGARLPARPRGLRDCEHLHLVDRRDDAGPAGNRRRHRRFGHHPDPQRRRAGRADRRRRPRRLHQLSRHLNPDDHLVLRLWRGPPTAR